MPDDTRVRAGLVGQASGFKLLRVDLAADEAVIRAEFLTKAAEKLGVPLPDDVSAVRLFLADGAPLDDMSMLEKDDTVWVALNGSSWREPGVDANAASSCEPPTERAETEQAKTAARSQQPKAFKPQASIGSFFGSGMKRTTEQISEGKWEKSARLMTEEELAAVPEFTAGACSGCGRRDFVNAGALVRHRQHCKGPGSTAASDIARAAAAAAAAVASEPAGSSSAGAVDEEAPSEPLGRAPKVRKDGKTKQSGLRQGEKRGISHQTYFKYEVVKTRHRFAALEKLGLCPQGAGRATSEFYNNLAEANISRWLKQEDELRRSLLHESRVDRVQSNRVGAMASSFSSKGARRMTLHRGRAPPFAACEIELHALYRQRRRGDGEAATASGSSAQQRRGGLRVTGMWLRIQMKRLVRKHCGDHAADCFKASQFWLRNFARRFGISLRRKSNSKAEPVEVRLPKIKRWHARLRRRLKRVGRSGTIDPVWGRWLPRNRLAVDQVPCNLRAGGDRTYEDKGAKRVWLAGSPADDGKRFCTLIIIARAKGDPSKPRHGQPKIGIIFRGGGIRVSDAEKAGYHPDVRVRFQKKAWADDELCEEHANDELREATAEARAAGERSVTFFDNLSGQTTKEHKRACNYASSDRHLLPTGTTGELMFIDGGIGVREKDLMSEEQDEWLEKPGNLERWTTGPKQGGLKAWEKRVLVTQWAGRAWEKLCCGTETSAPYNFEGSARSLGMLMTIDGSGDDRIRVQGLMEPYTFADVDGGSEGAESEVEEEPGEHDDVEAEAEDEDDEYDDEEEEGEEAEGGEDSSDEEDDTDPYWSCPHAPEDEPPEGFTYAPCPSLETHKEQSDLIGRRVLIAHERTKTLNPGWYMGKVKLVGVSAAWKKICPTANFLIKYTKKDTGNALDGDSAIELSPANYGKGEWWLLLDPVLE